MYLEDDPRDKGREDTKQHSTRDHKRHHDQILLRSETGLQSFTRLVLAFRLSCYYFFVSFESHSYVTTLLFSEPLASLFLSILNESLWPLFLWFSILRAAFTFLTQLAVLQRNCKGVTQDTSEQKWSLSVTMFTLQNKLDVKTAFASFFWTG